MLHPILVCSFWQCCWGNAVSWVKSRLYPCFPIWLWNRTMFIKQPSEFIKLPSKCAKMSNFQWNIIHLSNPTPNMFTSSQHFSSNIFPTSSQHFFPTFSQVFPSFPPVLLRAAELLGFRAAPKLGQGHGGALAWPGPGRCASNFCWFMGSWDQW